ncbi:helix-turn-helix transcriptional regulator [Tateyamaria pelophila]|uniref:helix-turn-helix transcriptional regulator n=1 Tax=Tateyamaria pelophila TaxID=328415 RepID=UPI001CBE30C2|nr:helix-turn-helix domain-containing protein [Tateyamaria pelophila]
MFLTVDQVADRYNCSKFSIWRWVREGRQGFPSPISLSPGCTRWRLSDLERWEAERAAEGTAA